MTHNLEKEVILIEIRCKQCGEIFYICQRCYCGHVYCGDECRDIAQKEAHRLAQHIYRTSPEGREVNRIAAQRRRIQAYQKTVADRSDKTKYDDTIHFKSSSKEPRCHCCGNSGFVVKRSSCQGADNYTAVDLVDSEETPFFLRIVHRRKNDHSTNSQPQASS